jgi:hypothetical protein
LHPDSATLKEIFGIEMMASQATNVKRHQPITPVDTTISSGYFFASLLSILIRKYATKEIKGCEDLG